MTRIAILYCKRAKDHSCIACAKCFKGIVEKNAQFGRHSEIDLVAMTDCGDCPGLIIPRVALLTQVLDGMGRGIEAIHLGTCIQTAMATSACPLDYGELKILLEKEFGIELILGTHGY